MTTENHVTRLVAHLRAALPAALAVVLLAPAAAAAEFGDDFGIKPGSFWGGTCDLPAVTGSEATPDEAREKRDCHRESTLAPQTAVPVTQAGAHPDASTTFELKPVSTVPGAVGPYADGSAKDIVIDLPPGLIGDPEAVPKCPQTLWALGQCPVETQVGIIELRLSSSSVSSATQNPQTCNPAQPNATTFPQFSMPGENRCRFPINNVESGFGETAAFGFNFYIGITVYFRPVVRTDGDYGIQLVLRNIPQNPSASLTTATLWGVPGEAKHDPFRYRLTSTILANRLNPGQPWPADVPVKPFLTNPTSCDGQPPRTTIRYRSWQKPDQWLEDHFDSPPVTGCEQVPFEPEIDLQPTSKVADSPSGLDVDITVPQSSDPDVLGTAHLDKVEVVLPEGTSINPAGAHGLEGCTDEQLGLKSKADATCPEASKIGTVGIDTPALPHPDGPGTSNVTGDVYLGQPLSNDPESGDMFRLFLVAQNKARGLNIKLEGSVFVHARTGRLATVFDDNPQVPVAGIDLHLKGGPHGVLALPQDCGTYTTQSRLTPWTADGGGQPVVRRSSFTISADGAGAGCPGAWPFAPSFAAGMTPATGGAHGGVFSMTIGRPDQQQEVGGLSVELPPGLLGKIAGVPLCGDAEAAAGTCPSASRVGTATVSAGPGSDPFPLTGSVSLTGPYKGAPYGLAVAVRAIAGPFDLGTVVVRQALHVDRTDAHITAVSDPLPTIVGGVPVKLRTIGIDIDRPGFMVSPTSCGPKEIKATLLSTRGATAPVSSPFQVNGCAALPFKPKMTMRLTGKRQTTDGKHPGMRVVVTQPPGEANLKAATVRLPLSLALDPDNAQALCEFEAGQRVDCPATSIIGQATAISPLIERPLTGPVYFVKNVRINPQTGARIRTLPTLLIPLRGEIALDLRATTAVERNKLVNTFPIVPDAQITRFELNLKGGKGGVIVVTGKRDICSGRQMTEVELDGQNGKRHDTNLRMATPCVKKKVAGVKIAKARWQGKRVTVSGRINRAATRRLTVRVDCGKTTVSKRVKPARGRWKATLTLGGRCADARRAKLSVRYGGQARVKKDAATRSIRRA
jgi:hypothetical protein